MSPAIATPWTKRNSPSCHGAVTRPCGIATKPASVRQANRILCEPMRSANRPRREAQSMLAKPALENTAPDNRARCSAFGSSVCTYTVRIGCTQVREKCRKSVVRKSPQTACLCGSFRKVSFSPCSAARGFGFTVSFRRVSAKNPSKQQDPIRKNV